MFEAGDGDDDEEGADEFGAYAIGEGGGHLGHLGHLVGSGGYTG